ncbi:nuclear protein DGCR14 [Mucor mucedo]|uniref:nuclear protein DGCR14 n=1 Tax=Mucor mucedo TaxID=29922 RepID=UPI0022210985|nr:nuclear protein DGCR14 [Mucor mucedo]KAI7888407.1 nuclear protein DGCR14 [Mucor mucedo]
MSNPVVLDEDTYTEAISLIIERDFFPNLARLRAQQNYLEAQATGSLVDLQQAGKELHDLKHPRTSQLNDDVQGVNYYKENEQKIENRVNLNLSLDQFQTLYTSEDNASFTDLLEKANIKTKQQNKWFFDRESKQLRITDQPHDQSPIQLIEMNEKAPSGWKYKARNALMYFPEGKSQSWVNDNDGRSKPKAIAHENTHVISTVETKKALNILAPSDRAAAKGSLTPWNQLNGLNDSSSSPGVRGYNLVESTPTLSPSRVGTPQMTWGSIEGTPLLLPGSETPGPQFSLPQVSKREQLGMRLSEKASKAYRKKTSEQQRNIRGTPRSGAGMFSPAAQHLLRKSHNTPRAESGFGDALRSSYGASPLGLHATSRSIRRPGATPTPIPLFRAGASPAVLKKK